MTTVITAQGVNTNALDFNSNDVVSTSSTGISNLDITGNMTIEFWIKIPAISTMNNQWCSIISKIQDNSKRTYAIWLYGGTNASTSDRGKILWQGWTSSTTANHNHNVVSITSLSPNLWYHIAVTRQVNGLARIYINGAEESSAPFLGVPASTSSTPLKLGQSVLDQSSHIGFIGTIDELRIWNTVRSSQEISDFRTRQISTATPGLVLCYNFNQGTPSGLNSSVTTVPDVSGNNFHGTLSGFALTGSTSNWVSAGFTLPVTWHSFNAEKLSNKVLLNWVTSSELNTKDFEVLHSTNAVSWSKIGTVVAAGNSNQQRSYSFTHLSPLKNSIYNYYRIKQNDLDEQYSFSKIISIFYNEQGPDLMVYPNPASDKFTLYLSTDQEAKLINLAGATVWKEKLTAGRHIISITLLPKGIYMLQAGKTWHKLLVQ